MPLSNGDKTSGAITTAGEHNITVAGEYTVLVRDDSSGGTNDLQTGSYDLYFVKAPGANELGELIEGVDNRNYRLG